MDAIISQRCPGSLPSGFFRLPGVLPRDNVRNNRSNTESRSNSLIIMSRPKISLQVLDNPAIGLQYYLIAFVCPIFG